MILFFQYLVLVLQLVLCLPLMVLFVQVVVAYFSKHLYQTAKPIQTVNQHSLAVIVPAHNEEIGLANTLRAIMPQLKSSDRLLVVADNCHDQTAHIAKSMGATVIERFNLEQRGKGYALDHAVKYLASDPPEVVLIVDADCIVSDNLIATLASECMATQRPVQANYLMTFEQKSGLKQQVTEFAWLVKNTVRPLGFKALNLPCQLMGTGMAFVWRDLIACNLASGHLVEDMQLGLDLAKVGKSPQFSLNASVHSYFPMSVEGQTSQRARWEHGHLSVMMKELPNLLNIAIRTKSKLLFAQALDLSVPPLALLFAATLAMLALSLLVWISTAGILSVLIAVVHLVILGLSVVLAWHGFGRSMIPFSQLLLAPIILLMKLPIYIGFVFRRQVDWVRSKRD